VWDGTFHAAQIRGLGGAFLWGWREAATFTSWRIRKGEGPLWVLSAVLLRRDPVYIGQSPLLFTAPKQETRDGFWAWPVIKDSLQIGDRRLVAQLGPPEQ
jgi:hypothetical protein